MELLLGLPFGVLLLLWLIMGLIAAWVAPEDRRLVFFLLTFFLLLGPLGVAAAAIAQPRRQLQSSVPVAPERTRYRCPQCTASSDVLNGAADFECWQCHGRWPLNHAVHGGPPTAAAPSGFAPPTTGSSQEARSASSDPLEDNLREMGRDFLGVAKSVGNKFKK
jgi:hypothetical protein